MTRETTAQAAKREILYAVCAAAGLAAATPAFSADAEVEALKAELQAQRKMIEQLQAERQAPESPRSAQEVQERLREKGKEPVTAPSPTPPSEGPVTDVKFYGTADAAVVSSDTGYGRKTRLDGGGGKSASRLGVQVTRTLRDQLRVTALAEAGVQWDTGSTGAPAPATGINVTVPSSPAAPGTGPQIFGRQIFLGVDAGFGQVSIGRQYTGSYIAATAVGSAHRDGLYGTTSTFTPIIGAMPTRLNNSLIWATKRFAGFYGVLTYTSGSENNVSGATETAPEATTSTNDKAGRGFDIAGFYSTGKFTSAVTTWNLNTSSWVTDGETGLAKRKGYQLAASYDFGVLRLHGLFSHGTVSGNNYENVTKTLSKASGYGVSVLVPMGKHNVVATFTSVDDDSQLNKDGKLYGLSYFYNMLPDTTLYVSAGKVNNNANASYSLPDGGDIVGNVARPGFSPSSFMGGLNYRF